MAFGQEMEDFVNGFKTGYSLFKSKKEREDEEEDRRMKREDHAYKREVFDYRKDRDMVDDKYRSDQADFARREFETNDEYRKRMAGVQQEQWSQGHAQDEERIKIARDKIKLDSAKDQGAIPDLTGTEFVNPYDLTGGVNDRYNPGVDNTPTNSIPSSSAAPESAIPEKSSYSPDDGSGERSSSPWLRYDNQNATRNKPLSSDLTAALDEILPGLGVSARVFSGGQEGRRRTGSHRHDHGNAADVFFYKDGRKLDWSNPKDRPLFEEIVKRGKQAGLTGFGAGDGYMQRGSMHIGFGAPGVWGAGGRGKNAPDWLRNAYYGSAGAANGGLIEGQPVEDFPEENETAQPTGLLEPGNIDLTKRPVVKNADGTISTVRSMSFEQDGKEILVPTVSPDGKIMSDEQAIALYHNTGQHLGIFDNAQDATAYAQQLHNDQAKLYGGGNASHNYASGGLVAGAPDEEGTPGEIRRGKDGRNYQYAETTGMAGATSDMGWIPTNQQALPTNDAPTPTPAPRDQQAIPDEQGSMPSPQYDGAMKGEEEAPTNDPWEAGRRAVRDGMKLAIKNSGFNDNDGAIDDPDLERMRQNYLKGYGAAPAGMMRQVIDKIDPDRKMPVGERNMMAMANVYKFYMDRGEVEKAQESAKSMLLYYQRTAQQFGALAQAAVQEGDLDKASKAAIAAYANIPNGRDMKIKKGDNGMYTVTVTDEKSGDVVNKKVMNPEKFAELAMGFGPGTFNDEILNAAGAAAPKYSDPSISDMATTSSDVAGQEESDFANSNLTDTGKRAIRSAAEDIGSVKENRMSTAQALELSSAVAGGADHSAKPVRGNPGLVELTVDGFPPVVMKEANARNLVGIAATSAKMAQDEKAKAEENAKWRQEKLWTPLKKGVEAFGQSLSEMDPEAQRIHDERHEKIRNAQRQSGAIPEPN